MRGSDVLDALSRGGHHVPSAFLGALGVHLTWDNCTVERFSSSLITSGNSSGW